MINNDPNKGFFKQQWLKLPAELGGRNLLVPLALVGAATIIAKLFLSYLRQPPVEAAPPSKKPLVVVNITEVGGYGDLSFGYKILKILETAGVSTDQIAVRLIRNCDVFNAYFNTDKHFKTYPLWENDPNTHYKKKVYSLELPAFLKEAKLDETHEVKLSIWAPLIEKDIGGLERPVDYIPDEISDWSHFRKTPHTTLGLTEYGRSPREETKLFPAGPFVFKSLGVSNDEMGIFIDPSYKAEHRWDYLRGVQENDILSLILGDGTIENFQKNALLYFSYANNSYRFPLLRDFVEAILSLKRGLYPEKDFVFVLPMLKFWCFGPDQKFEQTLFAFQDKYGFKNIEIHYEINAQRKTINRSFEKGTGKITFVLIPLKNDTFTRIIYSAEEEMIGTGDQSISAMISRRARWIYQTLDHKKNFASSLNRFFKKIQPCIDFEKIHSTLIFSKTSACTEKVAVQMITKIFDTQNSSEFEEVNKKICQEHDATTRIGSLIKELLASPVDTTYLLETCEKTFQEQKDRYSVCSVRSVSAFNRVDYYKTSEHILLS